MSESRQHCRLNILKYIGRDDAGKVSESFLCSCVVVQTLNFSKIVDFSQVLFRAAEQGKDGGGDRGAEKRLRRQVERGDLA